MTESDVPNGEQMTHDEKVRSTLLPTRVEMDWWVRSVLAFMQQTLQADDLRGVAEAVATIAPAVWGQHRYEQITALNVAGILIRNHHDRRLRSDAT